MSSVVNFKPREGRERAVDLNGFGRRIELLAIERQGSSGTDAAGLPLHSLDVQVAMYPGANMHLPRQQDPHINPGEVSYDTDEFMAMVTAAWQQDDPADTTTPGVVTTEQEIDGASIYAFIGDVAKDRRTGQVRVVPGSITRLDPSLVPEQVLDSQRAALVAVGRESAPVVAPGLAKDHHWDGMGL